MSTTTKPVNQKAWLLVLPVIIIMSMLIYKGGPISAGLSYAKVKGQEKYWSLGASYNLGVATVAASYQDPEGDAKGFTLGGSVNAGPVVLTLDIARDTEAKDTDLLVEAKYALSKRTSLTAYTAKTEGAKAAMGAGVRHNF